MIVIYAIVSRDVLTKHLRCRSFLDLGEVKISGLTDFLDPVQGLKRGKEIYPCSPSLRWISRVSFIKHLRLNITGMRSDNALPRPVSLRLILTSRIFPRLVFPGFPYSSKASTLNLSCKCHLLKLFLFHILHVTQSRVSMGLTVWRKPVEKLGFRRQNCLIISLI